VQLAVVAPLEQRSPFGVSWQEVLQHTARRLAWAEPSFRLVLLDSAQLAAADSDSTALTALRGSQAAVAVGVEDVAAAAAIAPLMAALPTAVALGSAPPLQAATRLGGREPSTRQGLLQRLIPDKQAKTDAQVGVSGVSGECPAPWLGSSPAS
jgi:hypothetical protein